jgi:uncharacterized membrane protein
MFDQPSDQRMESIIGGMLRTGVILSSVFVLGGGIWYLVQFGSVKPRFGIFQGEPAALTTVTGIVRGALALDARSLIQLGLLVLVATPVARVLFSVFAFAAQRDRTYVAITLIVAAVLLYSLFGEH